MIVFVLNYSKLILVFSMLWLFAPPEMGPKGSNDRMSVSWVTITGGKNAMKF